MEKKRKQLRWLGKNKRLWENETFNGKREKGDEQQEGGVEKDVREKAKYRKLFKRSCWKKREEK